MIECSCFRCTRERTQADPDAPRLFGQPAALMRMFLCQTCGNKRCPRAADHCHACSGSNEPGQPGSLYEVQPSPISASRRTNRPGPGETLND